MFKQPSRRVPYGAWVEETSERDGAVSFYLAHSLSPWGLKLLGKDPPQLGSSILLRLVVENERRVMSMEGEVVEHEAPEEGQSHAPCFAIRFLDLNPESSAFLSDLLNDAYS
jgi:hypothetical protein